MKTSTRCRCQRVLRSHNVYPVRSNEELRADAHSAGQLIEHLESRTLLSGYVLSTTSFGVNDSGASPGALVFDSLNGNFYGTTSGGGAYGLGTFFEIPNGSTNIQTLASFNGINGTYPSGLTLDKNGNLFGTTGRGGPMYAVNGDPGYGTVFEIANGTAAINTLGWFGAYYDEATKQTVKGNYYTYPTTGLTIDSRGNLYGATEYGLFEIGQGSTTIQDLAPLQYATTGDAPVSNLTLDASGDLFGATYEGGTYGYGALFELPAGGTVAHQLDSFNYSNGARPSYALVSANNGNLYGTTSIGGAYGYGTVFDVIYGGTTIQTLASFNASNGSGPNSLILDGFGDIFGTTNTGTSASSFDGTVFEIANGGATVQTLASFSYLGINGAHPASLGQDSFGNLYGTTYSGGSSNAGTMFKLSIYQSAANIITGTTGADLIKLRQDPDGMHIDWTNGTTSNQILINDPSGLTINGNGSNDVIVLDYTGGNPLPNTLHFNGVFTLQGLQGANPLATTLMEVGQSTIYVSYASPASDPLAAIRSYLQSSYNGGLWNKIPNSAGGVITSTAAASNPLVSSIGYADSADLANPAVLPANTIELRYTGIGDTNLDGTVGLADLAALLKNFGTGTQWDQGDLAYTATSGLKDLAALLKHFGNTTSTPTAVLIRNAESATLAAVSSADNVATKRVTTPVKRRHSAQL